MVSLGSSSNVPLGRLKRSLLVGQGGLSWSLFVAAGMYLLVAQGGLSWSFLVAVARSLLVGQ